jgi:mannose-6-phosphate isomerase-like protein (cupin superfamily)
VVQGGLKTLPSWHWESHVVGQLAVVISGVLVVDFKDGAVTLQSGDEAFIPPGCWHRTRNADASASCTWVFGYDGAH